MSFLDSQQRSGRGFCSQAQAVEIVSIASNPQ
jgi:hypothetical protein